MISAVSSLAWLVASGDVGLDYAESVVWPLGGDLAIKRLLQKVKQIESIHQRACRTHAAIGEIERTAPLLLRANVEPQTISEVAASIAGDALRPEEIRSILRSAYKRHIATTQNKAAPESIVSAKFQAS